MRIANTAIVHAPRADGGFTPTRTKLHAKANAKGTLALFAVACISDATLWVSNIVVNRWDGVPADMFDWTDRVPIWFPVRVISVAVSSKAPRPGGLGAALRFPPSLFGARGVRLSGKAHCADAYVQGLSRSPAGLVVERYFDPSPGSLLPEGTKK